MSMSLLSIKNLLISLFYISFPHVNQSFLITTPLNNNVAVSSIPIKATKPLKDTIVANRAEVKLNMLCKKQSIIYDGSEYEALDSLLSTSSSSSSSPKSFKFGDDAGGRILVTFITGTDESTGERYVGFLPAATTEDNAESADNNNNKIVIDKGIKLSVENAAKIPKGISDEDALSTAMASLINIHCSLPRIVNVGGERSSSSSFVSGKVVVLGGGEYATFAAEGLSAIGVDVTLISTNSIKIPGVKVLPPAVGEMEIGFSSVIGEFDSILDTLHSECEGVKYELNRLHKCTNYVSTYNKAQDIVRDSGVFFGPSKVKGYENSMLSSDAQSFYQLSSNIPYQFGSFTLQKLLDQKIIFKQKLKSNKNDIFIRSWSLKEFWEFTNWPRDTDGGSDSRFGLPLLTEIDLFGPDGTQDEEDDYQDDIDYAEELPTFRGRTSIYQQPKEVNPFVTQVQNIEQLQHEILSPKRNCLLFLTAPNCKTCFRLKPAYTRMARRDDTDDDDSVLYAQADVVSSKTGGKELGKLLGIEVVPTFIMFRDGNRFGTALSVSKLPSKKLEKAVELLVSGRDWDGTTLKELERE